MIFLDLVPTSLSLSSLSTENRNFVGDKSFWSSNQILDLKNCILTWKTSHSIQSSLFPFHCIDILFVSSFPQSVQSQSQGECRTRFPCFLLLHYSKPAFSVICNLTLNHLTISRATLWLRSFPDCGRIKFDILPEIDSEIFQNRLLQRWAESQSLTTTQREESVKWFSIRAFRFHFRLPLLGADFDSGSYVRQVIPQD